MNSSRRLFLRQLSAFSSLGAAAPMALNLAASGACAAQTASDYKALVCIFLAGGNDSFNTVLATDTDSWRNYSSVRGTAGEIGLFKDVAPVAGAQAGSPAALGGVLPLTTLSSRSGAGRKYALHPTLSAMQGLFNDKKRLAIVPNVGSLVEPITRTDYLKQSRALPKKLFSHNDQQSEWQTFKPEGAATGWGGRMVDLFASANGNSLFTAISVGDNSAWLAGDVVKPYRLGPNGAIRLGTTPDVAGVPRAYGSDLVASTLERIMRTPRSSNVMEADMAQMMSKAMNAESVLSGLLPKAEGAPYGPASLLQYNTVTGQTAVNPLAAQLQMVARMASVQSRLGIKRQVFFVNLYGFDTHDGQNTRHGNLMAQLNHGLRYFDNVLEAMGMLNQVTAFTASDFGRTFTCNGDGTDHGWGGHHFVSGGAVNGGDVYGTFPVYGAKASSSNDVLGSEDQIYCGVLVPRIALDQYGATLARWFGVPLSAMADIFPNLKNFASTDLGFMKA